MAYATINFHNPVTGGLKTAPVGFSWTTLFFGLFPALLRGHWGGAVVMLLVAIVTLGFSNLAFPFFYNRMYIKHLIGEGYKADTASTDLRYLEQRLKLAMPQQGALPVGV